MTPLIDFIVLVIVACIVVGIYFAVKGEDDSSSPTPDVIQWVAVGYNNKLENDNILYSPDGLSWQESTGMSFVQGNGVAYGTSDGNSPLWVAVGKDNTGDFGNIMYSTDGKEWQKTTTGDFFASEGNGVAYGTSDGNSPLWVAVGQHYNSIIESYRLGIPDPFATFGTWGKIMYSTDGKEWQVTTEGYFSDSGNGVAYGTSNGTSPLWVAIGNDATADMSQEVGTRGTIVYSENGKEWQETTTGDFFAIEGNGVAYGTSDGINPLWVAVGDDDTGWGNIMYSENGKEWQETTTGASFAAMGNGVAYGTSNGTSPLWVAVGYDSGRGNIMYSENGKEWQESIGASFYSSGFGVAYGTKNGSSPLWVAVGTDDGITGPGKTLFSTNGKEWQEPEDPNIFSIGGYGVAFDSILPNIPNFY